MAVDLVFSSLSPAASSSAVLISVIIVVTYGFLRAFLHLTHDPEEPELVLTGVPFLSPLIEMMRWNFEVFDRVRDKYPHLPIYTCRIPGARVYVVNSGALIADVERKWRTLIFSPLSYHVSEHGLGADKAAMEIVRTGDRGDKDFQHGLRKAAWNGLLSRDTLDAINSRTIDTLMVSLNKMSSALERSNDDKPVKFFSWVHREITLATTTGVFGPHNPLNNPKNEEAYFAFASKLLHLIVGLVPHRLLRKAVDGRAHLQNEFLRYQQNGFYNEENGGSAFIQRWTEYHLQYGLTLEQTATLQPGNAFAAVTNTATAANWVVYHVFSDQSLLQACREELSKAITVTEEKDGPSGNNIKTVWTLNMDYVKTSCHILLAVLKETFRFHAIGKSIRIAVEDEYLTDPNSPNKRYLIKKGSIVFMPVRVQHRLHENGWGPGETDDPVSDDYDLNKFDHTRFIPKPGQKRSDRSKPGAWRIFGGGATLCPGRHFATTEILAYAAMLVLRFDIRPTGKDGRWPRPTTKNSTQMEALEQPDHDVDVLLTQRKEAAGKEWRFSVGAEAGNGHAAILAEDM